MVDLHSIVWSSIGQILFVIGIYFLLTHYANRASDDQDKKRSRINSITFPLLLAAAAVWHFAHHAYGEDYQFFSRYAARFLSDPWTFYVAVWRMFTYGPVSAELIAFTEIARGFLFPSLEWKYAFRALLVSFNLISGATLYYWFKGFKGLLAAFMMLFNPFFALYSLNNGLNDSIAVGLFLLGLYMARGKSVLKTRLAPVILASSLLTKQYIVFPLVPLFALMLLEDRRKFVTAFGIFLSAILVMSAPFLVDSESQRRYIQGVVLYPISLTQYGHDLQSSLPNIGFAGIWSATSMMNIVDPRIYSFSTAMQVALMLVVLYVILSRKVRLRWEEVSFLGFLVFLIGSKYLWHNYYLLYIPLSLLVFLKSPISKTRILLLLGLLLAGEAYVLFDNLAFITQSYPPSYIFQDLLFFVLSTATCMHLLTHSKIET